MYSIQVFIKLIHFIVCQRISFLLSFQFHRKVHKILDGKVKVMEIYQEIVKSALKRILTET